jgi:NAD(P)-dependent dehydrogenase (short-subunit alcohol dehydrogenase family)
MASASPSGRSVLVTGAASGMGFACARRFQDDGWTVVAIDVAPIPVLGAGQIDIRADIRDPDGLAAALGALQPGLGPIHAVVNAAGIYPTSNLSTLSVELYRSIFDTNVLGSLLVIQAALPVLADGASIVNFASIDAFVPPDNQLIYMASKAAVVGATKALARELAPRGIRVNAIAPGWVRTPPNIASGRLEAALATIPLGRAVEPEEMAELVHWLSTGAGAQYVTGETIVASGGLVMR